MCQLCNSYPCDSRCPNHIPRATHYCSACGEGITDGEEYIENADGECIHWDCFRSMRDLLEFMGYEIQTMEGHE